MSLSKSGILYLTHVWNVAVGCRGGCPGCWARERWAPRMRHNCELCGDYVPHIHPERINDVTPRQKPAVIGLGFFADLCGNVNWLTPPHFNRTSYMTSWGLFGQLADLIAQCPQHTFLSLTRHPENLPQMAYPPNWWWGVTITGPDDLWRATRLLEAKTPHPWVSLEPLLGPVDMCPCLCAGPFPLGPISEQIRLTRTLKWCVVGAESGPKRRPCNVEWVRDVVAQCKAAKVPVYVKQISISSCGSAPGRVSHKPAEWPYDLQVREYPEGWGNG